MRRLPKRATPFVDKGRVHACRLGPYAIECMVGHKEDLMGCDTHLFCGIGVGGHMGFKGARARNRQHAIKVNSVKGLGTLKHIGIPV